MSLCRGLAQKDFQGEASRLLGFVRDSIRYIRDIDGVETIYDPVTLLQTGQGDCDDKSTLLAAMLLSIGFDAVRFIAVSFVPGQFSHVWVQINEGGKWIDLEATEPIQFGERIPSQGAVKYIEQDL